MDKEKEKVKENVVEEVVDVVDESKNNDIVFNLEVENVKSKSGRIYKNYVVKQTVIGRNGGKHEGRARLIPADNSGYTVLDLLFDGANELPLIAKYEYQIVEMNGIKKDVSGFKYYIQGEDPITGEVLDNIRLKPFQQSDKDWLEIFIKRQKIKSEV